MKTIFKILAFFLILICGNNASRPRLHNKIVGGRNATIQDFPYQVSVRYLNRHICGGSIFHNSYILTAAHCVVEKITSRFAIKAGSNLVDSGGIKVKVCNITVFSSYNPDTMDNDIAILTLCKPLTFSDKILPVALPQIGEELPVNTRAIVSGWGCEAENGVIAPVLKQVEVPIISNTDCQKAYSSYAVVTKQMICAGVIRVGGKDACQGDSGGPLRANGKLMGVVSWGFGCARPEYPGVYTKISAFRSWIKTVTNY